MILTRNGSWFLVKSYHCANLFCISQLPPIIEFEQASQASDELNWAVVLHSVCLIQVSLS